LPTGSDALIGVEAPTVVQLNVPDTVTPPGALSVSVNADVDDAKTLLPETLTVIEPGDTTKPLVTPV
jgi:hypothetical protein